ncbi:hypothetical protein AADZ91_10650 [Colwelliaceae bacterium 6441]
MSAEVSNFRLNVLRLVYLLIFVLFGSRIWPVIIDPSGLWDPIEGVAYSFWAAFSLLAVLGIRYPLKMLPLLFIQLTYKSIWLVAVGIQLWQADKIDQSAAELIRSNTIGVIIDLLVIPWPYVWANYIAKPKHNKNSET